MAPARYANTQLADPVQEKSARALMEEVRCLVCQGQSIADSDAETASDLRSLIRERVAAGESPEAIRAWLIDRYGSYISYAPAWSGETIALWLLPIILLLCGAFLMRSRIKRRVR
jgi:cytochrome c-type biogenesis protein CcmH